MYLMKFSEGSALMVEPDDFKKITLDFDLVLISWDLFTSVVDPFDKGLTLINFLTLIYPSFDSIYHQWLNLLM